MTPPIPLPTGDVWIQFPLIAVIVACFVLTFVGLFIFTKWVWGEYKAQRDIELDFRKIEALKRDRAFAEQNTLWREALLERDVRWEIADKITQVATKELAGMMSHMIAMMADHDAKAQDILVNTNTLLENQKSNTRRRPKTQE
jgi:hypothetical protein